MNEYDDSDEYSSGNSFRARSNTWPLNRPDLAVPGSGICIDETLPEIELEEEDLFTTNENWSTGLEDHDIMSWDPILNAQASQQQQQQQQQHQQQHQQQQPPPPPPHHQATSTPTTNQQHATIIHHHHQPHQSHHHQQQQHTTDGHQRQQSVHIQHHLQQQPPPPPPQPPQQQQASAIKPNQHPQQAQRQPQQQQHNIHQPPPEPILSGSSGNSNCTSLITNAAAAAAAAVAAAGVPTNRQLEHPSHQQQHQPIHHQQQLQETHLQSQPHLHQTLNSSHCLDPDDANDYHIQQLHHLHLDSNPHAPSDPQQQQQGHYVSPLSSVCIQSSTTASGIGNDSYISSDHQHNHHHHHHHHPHITNHHQHHLQPLTSARYDLDQPTNVDYGDLETQPEDDLQQHNHHLNNQHHHHNHQQQPQLNHQQLNQQPQPQHQHPHHHHNQPQQNHQLHQLTSSSLDNHSTSSTHMLSSSLSTSGIGLSGDLEDLDYKGVDPTGILHNAPYDDLAQDQQQAADLQAATLAATTATGESGSGGASGSSELKQSNSTSTSKTKLNTPRRNAWGNMSYADLISQAINSTSDKRLTLSQIYDWMVQHVPYFKDKGDSNSSAGWKNSVRHNLSLHSRFKRLQNEGTGKSSWWTINPEANVGKCARRRAASMEASKYEKKRGRAKKRAEAIRQGLVSYPSLTNSSLNGSTSTLEQQQAQSLSQYQTQQQQQQEIERQQAQQQVQAIKLEPFALQQQQQQALPPQAQHIIQTLEHYCPEGPSQQQQQHLQQLQQMDGQNHVGQTNLNPERSGGLYLTTSSHEQQYEEKATDKMQPQHQQSQYYYQFELSTAL